MPRGYKFNAFSGVFTPSILTILGVIMYMRLGWVVGQAGIIVTLIIILISHIISFSTGLSISSIATDKKIKAGGIYYILSRSLGLSMGGAIGIALTLGTALGISMYIVGFSENFLSIKAISEFIGLGPSTNSIRIVGSIVLALLTIIAMISTSLAIKTQYFILAAIAVSLVSIFAGFGINVEYHPDSPLWLAARGHVPFETVFAIFFPAVTGFTAGVAMSGDLRDPKRDIPVGTIAAIATGLIVYISLALGYGFFVKREILLTDNNVAMHVAWIPALVVAGIWGATLSSALGGILGAPRILQALSTDRITPAFMGKTYGKKNEPRIALIVIYLIAEGGILIGKLDVIAGIVTMFYLTSYGFINLAYVLESWANTDFRPNFRVPIIVGITGFVFAFAVMFKIDMISMFAAFLIIGGIYFYLERRQLKLEGGDVWRSVWISLIRKGLSVLISKPENDQNWQPNIILFTGGADKRPHLLEFARSLVGHYGFLTNFDLIVNEQSEVLFPKYQQTDIEQSRQQTGIFYRRLTVKDVYQGIEMIVRTYGFSGLEPNTVVLGWPRNTKKPREFVRLLQIIHSLDYNIILIDYDSRYGFGRYQQIDIWWRGAGNNGNFALTLAKLMTMNPPWRGAVIRLLIVNNDSSKVYYLYRRANDMLSNLRIEAQVKIINNEIDRRPFYDIVRRESKTADLVFIGLPTIPEGQEQDFIERTNRLLFEIGTVALIRASRIFKDLNLGVNLTQKPILAQSQKIQVKPVIAQEKLITSNHYEVNAVFSGLQEKLNSIFDSTIHTFVFLQADNFIMLLDKISQVIPSINKLILRPLNLTNYQRQRYILRYQNYLIALSQRQINYLKEQQIEEIIDTLENITTEIKLEIQRQIEAFPRFITLEFNQEQITKQIKKFTLKLAKAIHHTISPTKKIKVHYSTKRLTKHLQIKLLEIILFDIELIRIETLRFTFNFKKFFEDYILNLELFKTQDTQKIRNEIKQSNKNLQSLLAIAQNMPERVAENRKQLIIRTLNEMIEIFSSPEKLIKFEKSNVKNYRKNLLQKIDNEVNLFFESLILYLNQIFVENTVQQFLINARQCIFDLKQELEQTQEIELFRQKLEHTKQKLLNIINSAPKQVTIMDENSLNDSFYKNFSHIDTIEIPVRQNLNKMLDQLIFKPINNLLNQRTSTDKLPKNTLLQELTQSENLLLDMLQQNQLLNT